MKKMPTAYDPQCFQHDMVVFSQVYEELSRRRYATEQLRHSLEKKREALNQGHFVLADGAENAIARLSESVAFSMDVLVSLLEGQSVADFADTLPDHLKELLESLSGEISRLEWQCLKEVKAIKAFYLNSNGPAVGGANTRQPRPLHRKSTQAGV
jgi:hypothetical protein